MKRAKDLIVRINVFGGVAYLEKKSKGVKVLIVDEDNHPASVEEYEAKETVR